MTSIGGEFPADFIHINECVQQYKGQEEKLKVIFFKSLFRLNRCRNSLETHFLVHSFHCFCSTVVLISAIFRLLTLKTVFVLIWHIYTVLLPEVSKSVLNRKSLV